VFKFEEMFGFGDTDTYKPYNHRVVLKLFFAIADLSTVLFS